MGSGVDVTTFRDEMRIFHSEVSCGFFTAMAGNKTGNRTGHEAGNQAGRKNRGSFMYFDALI